MFCENCGSEMGEKAKFCPSCGHQNREPSAPAGEEASSAAAQETTAQAAEVPAAEMQAAAAETAAAASAAAAAQAPNLQKASAPAPEPLPTPIPAPVPVPASELAPVPVPEPEAAPDAVPAAAPGLFKRRWFQATLGAVAVAIIVAAVLIFVPLKGSSQAKPLLILGENELLLKSSAKADPLTITSEVSVDDDWSEVTGQSMRYYLGYMAKMTVDNKKLFFIDRIKDDGTGSLYYRDVNAKAKDDSDANKGVKLASGIAAQDYRIFTINDDGSKVFYLKNYDGYEDGGKLYFNDLKNETSIDSQVQDYWYSQDKNILYYTKNNDGKRILYFVDLKKIDDKTKVDSDIYYVESFDSATGKIYYSKSDGGSDDSETSVSTYTLYSKELNKDKTKLLGDISSVVSSIENDEFYYTTVTKKEVSLASLVDDDLAASDAAMKEPQYTDFQKTVQVPETDFWTGETYYYEETQTDYDAWYDASLKYEEKQDRDYLREELQAGKINDVSYDLNLFSAGKSTLIASDYVGSPFSSIKSKLVVYTKNDRKSMNKIKLSTLSSSEDVRSAYDETRTQATATYMSLGANKDIEFADKDTANHSYYLSKDGKTLYTIESTDSKSELVSYDISSGKPANRKAIDDEVDTMLYIGDADQIYYYKNLNDDDEGDLYSWKGGTKQKIAIDVQSGQTTIYPDEGVVLYLSEFDRKHETGTLSMYKDQKNTKIASDVGAYFFNYGADLYYLDNYDNDTGVGDLLKYVSQDKKEKIREEVYAIYPTMSGYGF